MALHLLYQSERLEQLAGVVAETDAVLLVDRALASCLSPEIGSAPRLPCPVYVLATDFDSKDCIPEHPGITGITFDDWVNLTCQHSQFVEWK